MAGRGTDRVGLRLMLYGWIATERQTGISRIRLPPNRSSGMFYVLFFFMPILSTLKTIAAAALNRSFNQERQMVSS